MPLTTVRNEKSKIEEGDKFRLSYYEFEVTEITQHTVMDKSRVQKKRFGLRYEFSIEKVSLLRKVDTIKSEQRTEPQGIQHVKAKDKS